MQVFAIEAQEQKIDIHPEANPTAVRIPLIASDIGCQVHFS